MAPSFLLEDFLLLECPEECAVLLLKFVGLTDVLTLCSTNTRFFGYCHSLGTIWVHFGRRHCRAYCSLEQGKNDVLAPFYPFRTSTCVKASTGSAPARSCTTAHQLETSSSPSFVGSSVVPLRGLC